MRILHYIPSIDRSSGGVGAYLQLMAHDLGRLVELHIVSHRSAHELSIENCTIHYIDGKRTHLLKAKVEFLNLLDELHPDVVHVNSCWELLSSYTVFWAKKKRYPVLITTHGMLEPWVIRKNYWIKKLPALLLYQKKALKMADGLVATAESERKNLQVANYNPIVGLVPNGVIMDDISLKDSWEPNKTILFLALLRPNKGADLLIKAVKKLENELTGYRVVIAGTGEDGYVNSLKELVHDLKLENVISFPGGIYGKDKWQLYQQADVFVLPTLNENFGIVIAESLASGTPVITTKGAPWPELEEWNCGWWVERDVTSFVKALDEFLKLPVEVREQMGRNGRRLVETQYSSKKVAEEMVRMYEGLTPGPSPKERGVPCGGRSE